jgi:hypothetical protein
VARQLVLMGSGETAPTMVEVHKAVVRGLGPVDRAVLIDTPYGFQNNADDLSARAVAYFAQHVGLQVSPVSLRDVTALAPAEIAAAAHQVAEADWVFTGPGSPTYLQRQWEAMGIGDTIRRRLTSPGATVLSSAAACTAGTRTLPVYEIYKVGQAPRWDPGLGLLDTWDLACVVIPHFDNAEGGTHDTRYCYLGERRLVMLEHDLEDGEWVLGIDEHTAVIFDGEDGSVQVTGRGALTVRVQGHEDVIPAGSELSLDELRATAVAVASRSAAGAMAGTSAARGHGSDDPDHDPAPHGSTDPGRSAGSDGSTDPGGDIPHSASPVLDAAARQERAATSALADGDAVAAAQVLIDLDRELAGWWTDPTQSADMDRARDTLHRLLLRLGRVAQAGLHDHSVLVAPLVEDLLQRREHARALEDWPRADQIRAVLDAAGITVRDTPTGPTWTYSPPDAPPLQADT